MKKLLLLFPILCILLVGCDNAKRETVCTLIKDEKTKMVVTITRENGKTTVKFDELIEECIEENLCSTTGRGDEFESDEAFDKLVKDYEKDGYSCEG